jgi:hypothetical protein
MYIRKLGGGGVVVGREGPLFVIMLSVRFLGDGSWQLFYKWVPGWPPLPPPSSTQPSEFFLCVPNFVKLNFLRKRNFEKSGRAKRF